VNVVIVYESLTGNTRKTAGFMADEFGRAGASAVVCPITRIDYQALSEADLVVVGTWTDGIVIAGQRPGRAGRLRSIPYLQGKRCAVYCTYAIDPGKTLDKLVAIIEARGADVIGGMAIRRNNLSGGAKDFVNRLMAAVAPS
jgi:hypothetical protein